MPRFLLTHLSKDALRQGLHTHAANERGATADLIAFIAEFDQQRLYAEEAFASMHTYCVEELQLSEDAADRRIRAARIARDFAILFEALADGRLSLTAILMLAPHLTDRNAADLIPSAYRKSNKALEQMLADRFPKPDVKERVRPISRTCAETAPAATRVESDGEPAPTRVEDGGELELGVEPARVPEPRDRVSPLGEKRYSLETMIDEETRDDLDYARSLLGHQVPPGKVGPIVGLAVKELIEKLEKRKFAATARPRSNVHRVSKDPRYVPAHVRRAVVARDAGQCTFVSERGRRCGECFALEFDHIVPVAHGGQATVDGIRLRCRTHNQYEAERAFGSEFMKEKREAASAARAGLNGARKPFDGDLVRCLRRLGVKAEDAREAAEHSECSEEAPFEERVNAALKWHGGARRRGEARRMVANGSYALSAPPGMA